MQRYTPMFVSAPGNLGMRKDDHGDYVLFTDFDVERQRRVEADKLLMCLVDQFDVYRNGWLGADTWRDRIGLPTDIAKARAHLACYKE